MTGMFLTKTVTGKDSRYGRSKLLLYNVDAHVDKNGYKVEKTKPIESADNFLPVSSCPLGFCSHFVSKCSLRKGVTSTLLESDASPQKVVTHQKVVFRGNA